MLHVINRRLHELKADKTFTSEDLQHYKVTRAGHSLGAAVSSAQPRATTGFRSCQCEQFGFNCNLPAAVFYAAPRRSGRHLPAANCTTLLQPTRDKLAAPPAHSKAEHLHTWPLEK